jgi:hypothetical protein
MENLKFIELEVIDTNEGEQMLLLFKDIYTEEKKIIITKKIRHYLDDIVSEEFLEEIYINIPLFYENHRTNK